MKKLIQKWVDRKLIDRNIIKDTQLFLFFFLLLIFSDQTDFIFWSDLKLANKDYAQM